MTRQINHLFASLVTDVVPGPTSSHSRKLKSSIRLEITNTMRVPLFWRNALGIMVCEPSSPSVAEDEYFYVRIEYEFDPGVKIDARELLDEVNLPENHAERQGIYEALKTLEHEPQWYTQRKFSYTLGISREDLEQAGGVCYLNDVDLVVGFDQFRDHALHPYSPPGQRAKLSAVVDPDKGYQQRIVLIDNAGIIGSRWVNTGIGVYEITPIADPQFRDGVYVTTTHDRQHETKTSYYTVDEAEAHLGFYRNQAEADAFGSPENRFKAELKDTEQKIARDKVEQERLKQEVQREKNELEQQARREDARLKQEQAEYERQQQRERETLERERERMKLEKERMDFERQTFQDRQKFEYDMRSRDRKDQSDQTKAMLDIAKTALSLVSVGLSVYLVIKKNTKAK